MSVDTILLGAGKGDYWISTMSGAGAGDIAVDSTDSIVVTGGSYSTPNIYKFKKTGIIDWQVSLPYTANVTNYRADGGISLDQWDNIYFGGGSTPSGGPYSGGYHITKLDPSGVYQWSKFESPGGENCSGTAIAAVTNSSLIVGHGLYHGGNYITGFNGSGSVQWRRQCSASGYCGRFKIGDGIYMCIPAVVNYYYASALILIKLNGYGNMLWSRQLSDTSTWPVSTIDANNNVYIAASAASSSNMVVIKYNSSGTIQWRKYLTGPSTYGVNSIAVDSNSNVYICGQTNLASPGTTQMFLAKYNTSGVLQWQRVLAIAGENSASSIGIDSKDNIIICGSNANGMVLAKLPNDGTLIGTYGPYTYAASNLTDSSGTATDSNPSSTVGSFTPYVTGNIPVNQGTTSLTNTIINL